MMTVNQLKAKLAKLPGNLTVMVDVSELTLGEVATTEDGKLDVVDAKVGPADFGQMAVISVTAE